MWLRHQTGRPRRRSAATRIAGAAIALATAITGLGAANPASAEVIEPFAKRYDESLYGDFKTIGNTVLDCPTSPPDVVAACKETQAAQGTKNNNNFVERRINASSLTGTFDSSTGQVTIPPGAKVDYARLFWGGNAGTHRFGRTVRNICDLNREGNLPVDYAPGDPLTTRPIIRVGGGTQSEVNVENAVRTPNATQGPHYYTAEANVTSSFAGAPTGSPVEVAVGNVWAPTGQGCVGGWSLTVVYKYDAPNDQYAPDRRNVYIWGGHVIQRSVRTRAEAATTIPVDGFLRTEGEIHAAVTAYEGDWNTRGDQFLVDGQPVTEPSNGRKDNFFVSEDDGAVSPKYKNNLSVDAKAFEVPDGAIPEGARSATLTFTSTGDVYVPSQLALSVPVPDLEVTKTASPAKVAPGGTLTYTVKAKNISKLPYPGAKFSDDLTDNLDDATYNNDAKASMGDVSYSEPKISYLGDIPAGQTATITYSVKVNDPKTGDGKLKNNVDVESPRSNCENGSTDPSCGSTPQIVDPKPPVVPQLQIINRPSDPVVPPCSSVTNTITLTNKSAYPRKAAQIRFPVKPGGTPKPSSGTITKSGGFYIWKGDVPAHGKVTIKQLVKASCTPGGVVVITVTGDVPKTTCPMTKRAGGGTDPCTSVIISKRVQGRAVPPQLAETGGDERTLLYGGLAVVLCGLGALALAAARGRDRD
ncbi:DUF7927 domain-containing protein [Streptomyces sp. NBC_01304]|uniref:DUF7927 domain-containing protein n=1 Tax=Streptomyces sp. NBC_01304 TaxID=2903818 RepID=UPI002E0FEDC6|nr:DUF11 domain-containing protein [Streptomyces sp. NBC_01304]